MTELYYHKYNKCLNKETLLFWMKFYFNGSVTKTIYAKDDTGLPTKAAIIKGNQEFINFSNKVTNIMNDLLYGYYMSVFDEFNTVDIPDDDAEWDDEIISDDPMDYLPKNPSIKDVLTMHYSSDGQCYSSSALIDIFEKFNTSFMGLTEGKQTLKIYANMFSIEIFQWADAIDVSVIPSDIEWSKAAINDYFNMFKNNELVSNGKNLRTYEATIKRFYNYLKDSECILSNFYYEGEEHLQALFSLAMDGFIKINSVKDDCISINAEEFFNSYNKDKSNDMSEKTMKEVTTNNNSNVLNNRLSEIDKHIISVRAYLEANSPERVTYKRIARFLTDNGIYRINENNIKQKVSWIFNKLGVQDLASAVVMLREANALIEYDNVKV